MASKKEAKKVPVPRQVQKRYKQDLNRYKRQTQKSNKIQNGNRAA